ncbi:hypothetical protein SLEP1_g38797 [Rubroshorea leprosula]|uniref:Uncharacterized protein n=1 Tax=Rubroshorea leprosula TaxID=152421 RepID=A0AAV5KYA2_9ROSI|nr:hypothetical protein SLEP1_g38797 [Rubroshorea leprosula]
MAKLASILAFSLVLFLSIWTVLGDDDSEGQSSDDQLAGLSLDQLSAAATAFGVEQAANSLTGSADDDEEDAKDAPPSWTDWARGKLEGLDTLGLKDLLSSSPPSPVSGPAPSVTPASEPSPDQIAAEPTSGPSPAPSHNFEPDSAYESTPNSAPGAAPVPAPGLAPGPAPGLASGPAPGLAPGPTPGPSSGPAPELELESADLAFDFAPGSPSEMPMESAYSPSVMAPEFAPESAGDSIPADVPAPAPVPMA